MATEAELERLVTRLVGDNSDLRKSLQQAINDTKTYVDETGRLHDQATGKFVAHQKQVAAEVAESRGVFASMFSKVDSGYTMMVAKATAFAASVVSIGAITKAAFSGIQKAAEMEQAEIAFGVLFKDVDKAKSVLADLSHFADTTPFELPELTTAARQLAAFGVSADDINIELKTLGDIAAGIQAPIAEIASIYGKARVQGRLFAEDINQFTGRGIPVVSALARELHVAETEVKALVEKGKVGFPELQAAFRSMTEDGGQFAGMMEKQSESLNGLWSTMHDSINATLRDIGKKLIDTFDIKHRIQQVIAFIDRWRESIADIMPILIEIGVAVTAFVGTLMTIVAAQKAIATAQTVVLALMGPVGWKNLAIGAAVAAAAISGVAVAFDGLTDSLDEVTELKLEFEDFNAKKADEAAKATESMAKSTEQVRDRMKDIRDELELLTAADTQKPFVKMQQELQKFRDLQADPGEIASLENALRTKIDIEQRQADDKAKADEIEKLKRDQDAQTNKLKAEADSIIAKTMTPLEKLREEFARIKDLGEKGFLTEAQRDRANAAAQDAFDKSQAKPKVRQAILDFGATAEQRQAILLQSGGLANDPAKATADQTKELVGLAKEQVAVNGKMAASLSQLVQAAQSPVATATLGA
jgi:tape measure domain-containing protein